MNKGKKITKILILTGILTLSLGMIASATTYYTSIQVDVNSNLYGAFRSYEGNHYSMTINSVDVEVGASTTTPTFKVVKKVTFGREELGRKVVTLKEGYTHSFEIPGSFGSGTRAFDVSTVMQAGFTSNNVKLSSY